jgi:hypothetical protein
MQKTQQHKHIDGPKTAPKLDRTQGQGQNGRNQPSGFLYPLHFATYHGLLNYIVYKRKKKQNERSQC